MDAAVTITKAMWDSWAPLMRTEKFAEVLTILHSIDQKTHPLYGTNQAGRLPGLKKELEEQVAQYLEWEAEHEKNRTST